MLDQAERQLERGDGRTLEVIDAFSPKNCENRRIEVALRMLKLPTIKTLAWDSTR